MTVGIQISGGTKRLK